VGRREGRIVSGNKTLSGLTLNPHISELGEPLLYLAIYKWLHIEMQ